MWKLTIILSLIFLILLPSKEETVYIIIDDCKKWKESPKGKLQDQFSFYKQSENNRLITIGHGWIEPSSRLLTKKMTMSQIMENQPMYTSALDDEAWFQLLQDSNRKFLILRPDDFCTSKRFTLNHQFTLYEAKIFITRDE